MDWNVRSLTRMNRNLFQSCCYVKFSCFLDKIDCSNVLRAFVRLQEEPIHSFRVSNYLEYMEGLERNYRSVVLSDMRSILARSN